MAGIRDLTDRQLLDELSKLAREGRDRVEERIDEAVDSVAAIGPAFVFLQQVGDALSPGNDGYSSSMFWLRSKLEEIAANAPIAKESAFDAFLADHPELGHSPAMQRSRRQQTELRPRVSRSARQVNEQALLRALEAASEKAGSRGPVSAGEVARTLFTGDVSHAERVRVGQALARLAANGQVRRVHRPGHTTYGWAPAGAEGA